MLERLLESAGLLKPATLPDPSTALPGRAAKMPLPERHAVNGRDLRPPYPPGMETALFALGCFWGAERRFWQQPGVYLTAVGYVGGLTPNPTYKEVCSGLTGHTEAVWLVFDPAKISYGELLRLFWESHDPTQGMRQGNDHGTQYRSAIGVYTPAQQAQVQASLSAYQQRLAEAGFGAITTEIITPPFEFYFAEEYHQQYLQKNPTGYCGLKGTGVSCPL
ncbi:MAG: peptide-methionine (S)-S-oxide reductase MsrA [Candidatus Methylumidiphilus sp.]